MICLEQIVKSEMIFQTNRLRLEIIGESHFDNLANLLANPRVHRLWPEPKTRNREQSRTYFDKIQKMYVDYGYSFFAVVRKEDDLFVGICGALPDEFEGTPEIEVAYRIEDRFWGNGYAPEAAKACMEYVHEQLGWNTVISLILPENVQSQRVAEKNGLIPSGEKIHVGMRHIVWRKRWE